MMLMMGREGERVGRAQSERLLPPPPSYSRSSILSCSVLGCLFGSGVSRCCTARRVMGRDERRDESREDFTPLPPHRHELQPTRLATHTTS